MVGPSGPTYAQRRDQQRQQQGAQITQSDSALFVTEAFDVMKQQMAANAPAWLTYEDYSPIYYFKYFMTEAVATGNSTDLDGAFRLLFVKQGNELRAKPGLEPVKSGENFTFTAANGADVWRDALKQIMLKGFKGVKVNQLDEVSASLQSAMLESRFVRYIGSQQGTPGGVEVFWRCDARPKDVYIEGQTCTCHVQVAENVKKFNLDKTWHPYSEDEIRSKLWLRAHANIDNDYYTVVSVGLDFRTCTAFPTLDEKKAYSWELTDGYTMKSPAQWSDGDLGKHKDRLALVNLAEGGQKIRVATTTYAYMMALNSGVVIDTTTWAGTKGAAKFPERGVRGIPKECFVAYIPLLRIHHGPTRKNGFTLFRHPLYAPQLLLSDEQLKHRFGEQGAATITMQYNDAVTKATQNLRTAWASDGNADPDNTIRVLSLAKYPADAVTHGDQRLS